MALGIVPGDSDSATKAFDNLKAKLDKERAARITGQVEIDVLTWAVKDLKIYANRFVAQIPTLEDKVKHLKNKVVDGLNEVRAWEVCLERTTRANKDYKKQDAQRTKKLESKSLGRNRDIPSFLNYFLFDPALTRRVRCLAQCLEGNGGQRGGLLLPRRVLL
jgi:chromosome segregation ATPase